MNETTRLISAIERGDAQAAEQLLPLVFSELRRLATERLAWEKPGQTLQATALVHEAYLRLVDTEDCRWNCRGHFFAAAAEAMRRILIERARRMRTLRRGGNRQRAEFDPALLAAPERSEDLLALDEALDHLAVKHTRKAELVKLRFFAGLSMDQAAETLGISVATAHRDWNFSSRYARRSSTHIRKGIIHRDIKPSNVLVTMYDDSPVPKVIDFGVAKAIEQRLTERTLFTQYGALVGTFEYMSPEQAEMNALGIDTRSDVYSLGVLLSELLTGTTPLEKVRLRQAALGELIRQIKEEEPPRPSVRLSGSGDLPRIAAARKTEPARLSKLVRGEVDWIMMKCLEKDRTRRYETASGLARDVERHVKDEPVEACPPTGGYQVRKFARKNKMWLASAARACRSSQRREAWRARTAHPKALSIKGIRPHLVMQLRVPLGRLNNR
jgi:RNA polymerase sigma factor (TIGR02999 family)